MPEFGDRRQPTILKTCIGSLASAMVPHAHREGRQERRHRGLRSDRRVEVGTAVRQHRSVPALCLRLRASRVEPDRTSRASLSWPRAILLRARTGAAWPAPSRRIVQNAVTTAADAERHRTGADAHESALRPGLCGADIGERDHAQGRPPPVEQGREQGNPRLLKDALATKTRPMKNQMKPLIWQKNCTSSAVRPRRIEQGRQGRAQEESTSQTTPT